MALASTVIGVNATYTAAAPLTLTVEGANGYEIYNRSSQDSIFVRPNAGTWMRISPETEGVVELAAGVNSIDLYHTGTPRWISVRIAPEDQTNAAGDPIEDQQPVIIVEVRRRH